MLQQETTLSVICDATIFRIADQGHLNLRHLVF
jgi:hypothetical protein